MDKPRLLLMTVHTPEQQLINSTISMYFPGKQRPLFVCLLDLSSPREGAPPPSDPAPHQAVVVADAGFVLLRQIRQLLLRRQGAPCKAGDAETDLQMRGAGAALALALARHRAWRRVMLGRGMVVVEGGWGRGGARGEHRQAEAISGPPAGRTDMRAAHGRREGIVALPGLAGEAAGGVEQLRAELSAVPNRTHAPTAQDIARACSWSA